MGFYVIKHITHDKPDEDVIAEENRIKDTPITTLIKSDALLLHNLKKRFWSFPAVDGVSVGMPLNGKDKTIVLCFVGLKKKENI